VASPGETVVAIARRKRFLAVLIASFAGTRKNVDYLAVIRVLVVADARAGLECATHNFAHTVCKHFHKKCAISALELRKCLSFDFIEIDFHIFLLKIIFRVYIKKLQRFSPRVILERSEESRGVIKNHK
jgi:hypothetical protein